MQLTRTAVMLLVLLLLWGAASAQYFPSGGNSLHAISFAIDGGGAAIATGDLNIFPEAHYSCTIRRAFASAYPSGSITVDIWKTNAAIPTSSNKISASAPVTLSSAQRSVDTTLTGWTTSVVDGDVFGATVATASTVQKVTIQLWCN